MAACSAGGVVLWDVATRKRLADVPLPVAEGDVVERGLQPRRQDPRRRVLRRPSSAAAWCSGTWPHASDWRTSHSPSREGDVRGVAFSPDGKTLAAGFVRAGRQQRRRRGALGRGRAQAPGRRTTPREGGPASERGLQPRRQDPRRRIRRAINGGVVLWDVAARKRLADAPLPVERGHVTGVAFSPDGKTLAAGFGGAAESAAWCCGTWPRASAWPTTRSP